MRNINELHIQSFMEALFQDLTGEGEEIPDRPDVVLCSVLPITDADRIVQKGSSVDPPLVPVTIEDYDHYDLFMTTVCALRSLWRTRLLQMIENSGAGERDETKEVISYIITDIEALVAHLSALKITVTGMYKSNMYGRSLMAQRAADSATSVLSSAREKFDVAQVEVRKLERTKAVVALLDAGPLEQLAQVSDSVGETVYTGSIDPDTF